MNSFEDQDFVLEQQRATLESFLRHFENKYFQDVEPITTVEVGDIDGPSKYDPATNVISVHKAVAQFPKVCRVLLLHELIHNKLWKQRKEREDGHGELFQKEVKELLENSAYTGLL
jgi:hypothetical protein